MTPKPNSGEWWNSTCQDARKKRRASERAFQRHQTASAKLVYKESCKKTSAVIKNARNDFYKSKLINCEDNPKQTYKLVNKLLDKSHSKTTLPTALSDLENAEQMKNFFKQKVDKIYCEIEGSRTDIEI